MVVEPKTADEIYSSLKTKLTDKIDKLTNFAETSFNYVWTHDAFAEYLEEYEYARLAAQFSGWIDYTAEVDDDDLTRLGITDVEPEDINQYLEDEDLDNYVSILGVSRDEGSKAVGEVEFTVTTAGETVPADTEVATEPDAEGDYISFFTDSQAVDGDSDKKATVDITAEEVGSEYNVGSGTLTHLPSPPSTVQSVTNPSSTSGGSDEETNEELRERAKRAVVRKSGGGTTAGIEGYVLNNTGAASVFVEEFPSGDADRAYPHSHVIADGGTDAEVLDAIDTSKPAGVEHVLVRPTKYTLDIDIDVEGASIGKTDVKDAVSKYISDLQLGDEFVLDKVRQLVMNADDDIQDIEDIVVTIKNETHTYATGTSIYSLNKGVQMEDDGIVEVTDAGGDTYTEDTDYAEVDDDSDSSDDAIDWGIGGSNPNDTEDFYVDYTIQEDIPFTNEEVPSPGVITVTVV